MIKFQATANIHSVSGIIEIASKNGGQPFQKRELILDDSWDKDGKHYPNFIVIEFSGEKMQLLDGFWQGQRVTVDCILSGREANGRVFNTVRGQGVMLAQQPQQQYPPQQSQWVAPGMHQTARPQQPPVATGYPPMPPGVNYGSQY